MAVGVWVGLAGLAGWEIKTHLRTNFTESMPQGFWLSLPPKNTWQRGDTVAVCLSPSWQTRRYIGPGNCDNGTEPLLKAVGAIAGDTVELSASGAAVNNVPLTNTAPLIIDSTGRPLLAWPFGRYVVADDEVFLFSSYNNRSFDSRYFGPVKITDLIARAVPLYTWNQTKE